MQNIVLWRLGVFLFIFAPVLNVGIGAFGDTLSLLCLFFIAAFLYSSLFRPVVLLQEAKNLALILIFTIGYGLFGSLFFSSEPGSLQVALRPLRALIMFLGIYVFILAYAQRFGEQFGTALICDVFLAIGIHSLIMIAQFVFPALRDAIYPYTFADQGDPFNQMFRMAGLTNGGGAQLSLFQSLGLLLWPFVLANRPRFYERFISNVLAVCISLSLILSGRSGIILVIIMLPVVLGFTYRRYGSINVASFFRQVLIFSVATGGILYCLNYSGLLEQEEWAFAGTAFDRILSIFFENEGFSRDDLIQDFKESLVFPDDAKILLFGDPFLFDASYLMSERIVQSDFGYVIFLYGYGFLGSSLQYAFYGLILWYAVRHRRFDNQLALITIIWAVAILGFHAKEVLVFSRIGFSFTAMFFIALAIKRANAFGHQAESKTLLVAHPTTRDHQSARLQYGHNQMLK